MMFKKNEVNSGRYMGYDSTGWAKLSDDARVELNSYTPRGIGYYLNIFRYEVGGAS